MYLSAAKKNKELLLSILAAKWHPCPPMQG
jgi:hypothetical protein